MLGENFLHSPFRVMGPTVIFYYANFNPTTTTKTDENPANSDTTGLCEAIRNELRISRTENYFPNITNIRTLYSITNDDTLNRFN